MEMHLCCCCWFKKATMSMIKSMSLHFHPFLFLCPIFVHLLLLLNQKLIVPASAIASGADSTDARSLLAFKLLVEDHPLGALQSWNDSLHFCQWEGITCGHRHHRVTMLNLSSKQLAGSLSPALGNLTFLRYLNMEENNFHGRIPEEIGRLTRLQSLYLGNNSLDGEIPRNLSSCTSLVHLSLSRNSLEGNFPNHILSVSGLKSLELSNNNITGAIPDAISNLTSLEMLGIAHNKLEGSMPSSIGRLTSMKKLLVSSAGISGTLPSSIYNLSLIEVISLVGNQLHGSLSPNIGFSFPKLRSFLVTNNNFSGHIPLSFSNASDLKDLQLGSNSFSGKVGVNFGSMKNFSSLSLDHNYLGSGDPTDLDFLNSLANCSSLSVLVLNNNGFRAVLPGSFANLSTNLAFLAIGGNRLFGEIPSGIGNLVSLYNLGFQDNDFEGNLPLEIGKLSNLGRLSASWNAFSGLIPESLGNLTRLVFLCLENNKFHGAIPASVGKFKQLNYLSLTHNNLTGVIPKQVFTLAQLGMLLDLSQNKLSGELPLEIGNLKSLTNLNLSHNAFTGTLPSELGNCESLEYLDVQGNNFHGPIPSTFSSLRVIRGLDLSSNNLSGQIPNYFSGFSMSLLNLSYNNFEGKVPTDGVFSNASTVSLLGNIKLCGGASFLNLPICRDEAQRSPKLTKKQKILTSICIFLFGFVLLSYLLYFWFGKKKVRKPKHSELAEKTSRFMEVAYADLLKATNNFSSDNLIGKGYFSSVYKGILEQDGLTVAVKVLDLQLHGAIKSFTSECEALRTIRHRNLLKTITSCSTIDFKGNNFKAIVYEFMPNGCLDSWLHVRNQDPEEGRCLNLLQRVNIAIDVVVALDYLHRLCHIPIVHCDLKPSNVLLDENMIAHVGDFGLAKLITNYTKVHESSSAIRGTIGYAAPEYGQGRDVSAKGDTYSYGILLLEMITRKRPTDTMFVDGLNLHSFVDMALSHQAIEDVVDSALLSLMRPIDPKMVKCLVSLLKLGVACSMESPVDRMDIENVIKQLQMVKAMVVLSDHQN